MLLPQRNHGMEDIGRRSTYYLEYDVARTFIEGVVGYEMDETEGPPNNLCSLAKRTLLDRTDGAN